MSEHKASIVWKNSGPDFLKGKYSREHVWRFDGGLSVQASPSPANVPAPYSNPASIDPEEAFVASVSSCHLLTYLFEAYKAGFAVESYEDDATGLMTKNEKGVAWVSTVILRPRIVYGEARKPKPQDEENLHELAHAKCFIANSIKGEVKIERPAQPGLS